MKILLYVSILLSYSILLAQPTIVESFAPVAGTQWTEHHTEEVGGITLGNSGSSQTWTYTNFTAEFEDEPLAFLDISSLPIGFDGMFPNAEMAFYDEEDSTAQFFFSQPDGFYLDGFGSISVFTPPPNNSVDFDPNLLFLPFDFTFQDTRSNIISSETYIDGDVPLLYRSTTVTDFEGDGYGTITTPGGTYDSVLRIRIFRYRVDSVFADINFDSTYEFVDTDGPTDTTITYQHVQNAEPLVVATITMNPNETEIIDFNYIVAGVVGIEENEDVSSLVVYPNPSNGIMTLNLSSINTPSRINVYDVQGRLVHEENPQSSGISYEMDLLGLGKGLYYLVVLSEGQRISTSIAIE